MSDCIFIQQLWQKNEKVDPAKAFERMEKKWVLEDSTPIAQRKEQK